MKLIKPEINSNLTKKVKTEEKKEVLKISLTIILLYILLFDIHLF